MIPRLSAAASCPAAMKRLPLAAADPDRLETWAHYAKGMCQSCQATCCTLPVEVGVEDLIRLELLDPFEREEPPRQLARQLTRRGVIEHFNHKQARFTLSRHSSGACLFLDRTTRRCTVYAKRPDTCRNHPQIGPRPGYCAYRPR